MVFRSLSLMGADGFPAACYAASMEPRSSVPENAIGRILTAAEVAAIFRVDVRTVRRYYEAFGASELGAPYGSMKIA